MKRKPPPSQQFRANKQPCPNCASVNVKVTSTVRAGGDASVERRVHYCKCHDCGWTFSRASNTPRPGCTPVLEQDDETNPQAVNL